MSQVKTLFLALAMIFGANVALAADASAGSTTTESSKFVRDYSQVDNFNP